MAEHEDRQRKQYEKEACDRLARARQRKADITPDLMEGYFFTNPRRAREVQSAFRSQRQHVPQDAAELQTTVGTECSQDFAGLIVNTFMPANFPWVRRGRGMVKEEDWEAIKDDVEKADLDILAAVRASNFDAVAYQAFDPDLSIGTVAIWIEEDEIWKLPRCRAIPLRKLEIDLGPDGEIGPRFVVDHVPGRDVAATVGKAENDLPAKLKGKIKAKPDGTIEVVWALWRDWSVRGTETWHYCLLADKTLISHEVLTGEGCCPLIVTPWAPNPDSPWGDGCALKALPYLRVVDVLSAMVQDRAEIVANPPFTYPHDGVINFEGGIEAGKAYPTATGTKRDEFVPLYFEGNPDQPLFTIQDLERAIKRLWFVDRPEQLGKTPPTAAQWLDELVEMQKRIGLVGQKFWRDGPRAFFLRYKFLLEARGVVAKFSQIGALEPYNPAIRGQEYQEVQIATQLLGLMLSYGGVQGQAMLDAPATFANIKQKLGDKIVVFQDPKLMTDLLAKLIPQADLNIGNTARG